MKDVKDFTINELNSATRYFATRCGAVGEMVRRLYCQIDRITGLRAEVTSLEEELGRLQNCNLKDQARYDKDQARIKDYKNEVEELEDILKVRDGEVDAGTDHIKELKNEIYRRNDRVEELEGIIDYQDDIIREYQDRALPAGVNSATSLTEIKHPEPPKPRFTRGGVRIVDTWYGRRDTHYINDRQGRRIEVHGDVVLRDRIIDFLNEED